MSDPERLSAAEAARLQRAAHFAALRVLAEAASMELKAAGDAAEMVARSGAGYNSTDPAFLEFLARTRAADEKLSAALRRHQSAWKAFLDTVLADDDHS